MNVYDAGRMADVLAPEGYDETLLMEEADLVILNTCHIRERASEKIFSELGKIRELKDEKIAQGGEMTIALARKIIIACRICCAPPKIKAAYWTLILRLRINSIFSRHLHKKKPAHAGSHPF